MRNESVLGQKLELCRQLQRPNQSPCLARAKTRAGISSSSLDTLPPCRTVRLSAQLSAPQRGCFPVQTVCRADRLLAGTASSSPTEQELDLDLARKEHRSHLANSRWQIPQNGHIGLSNKSAADGDLGHEILHQAEARCTADAFETKSLEQAQSCVRLLYLTGWRTPIIHYSVQGAEWAIASFEQVESSRGQLCEAVIQLLVPDMSEMTCEVAATLEFVITDGQDNWDKPRTGGNYTLSGQGTFVLQNGAIEAATGGRCLVASDLDDTLVGDDAGTHAFRQFWEDEAVFQGSRLIFNTGRALDSFLALQSLKADCLPIPDLLIAAVGTKIFKRRNGLEWIEDAGFAAQLDEGWDLHVVREACYQAVMTVGRDSMHFRPPEEQNNHKVTCGVLASQAATVQESIQSALSDHQVQAKLVFSGKGRWRYLDIVSQNAGKADALKFAMQQLGFSSSNTIACGDSGNDRDMLAAANLAIAVGNAQPDLKQWLASLPQEDLYAAGRLRLAQAKAHHAHGILEGMQQLGFIATPS